ncbi:MAG: SUMF1/EgtB/PvdO family nonheme iron enzyme [Gammaproteobacteria bacterium]|nr:SUMF1/EgtB/PvdO family nonheme iron enzyme [Gammaproteobacteria bacterium]
MIPSESPPPEHTESLPSRGSRIPLVIGVVSLLILAGSLALLLNDDGNEHQVDETPPPILHEPKQSKASPDLHPPPGTSALTDAITSFVERDDWDTGSLNDLLSNWNLADEQAQAAARKTRSFRKLETELRSLIKEELALTDGVVTPALTTLVDFGSQLGLDFKNYKQQSARSPPDVVLKTPPPHTELTILEDPSPASSEPGPENRPTGHRPPDDGSSFETEAAPTGISVKPPRISVEEAPSASPPRIPDPESKPASSLPESESAQPVTGALTPAGTEALTPSSRLEESKPGSKSKPDASVPLPNVTQSPPSSDRNPERVMVIEDPCTPVRGGRRIHKCRDKLKSSSKGPALVVLPGTRFTMGSQDSPDEQPLHRVSIAAPFAISIDEISYGEYAYYCRKSGLSCPKPPWKGPGYPMVNISRRDADRYTNWLSEQSDHHYRLPTEAEWEYASRAGTRGPYPLERDGLSAYAYYSRTGTKTKPHPRKPRRTNPNGFQLYMMAGNIREWVSDHWHPNYQGAPADGSAWRDRREQSGVVRGGSYVDDEQAIRSSARQKLDSETKDTITGFRVVRDIPMAYQSHPERWGDWWLNKQKGELFTNSLLVLNNLDDLRRLQQQHPTLPFKTISPGNADPGYRVLLGLYDTEAEARQAYQVLPAGLKKQSGHPATKRIRDLRR